MEAAKQAVKNFTNKHGHHDTTVHEKVAPAVQNETVTRQQEDRVTTALDKEVHQDHYHTTVQPVKDTEVLPEKHHHNLVGVEHRKFEHDDHNKVKQTLDREAAQFRDTTERVEGKHTTSAQPVAAGEHVHHHVHETIQPVINKQTIEPHVVHTTVPIHEVHHNAAQHHATTALPAVSMSDYKKQGGALTGREERQDAFDGCPKPIGGEKDVHGNSLTGGSHSHSHGHGHDHSTTTGSTGLNSAAGAGVASGTTSGLTGNHSSTTGSSGLNSAAGAGVAGGAATGAVGSKSSNVFSDGAHGTQSAGLKGTDGTSGGYSGNRYKDLPESVTGHNTNGNTPHSTDKANKPSLLDRLNPLKDADHDGKKGFND